MWTTAHRWLSVHEIWAQKPFRSRPLALAGSTHGAEQRRRDLDATKMYAERFEVLAKGEKTTSGCCGERGRALPGPLMDC